MPRGAPRGVRHHVIGRLSPQTPHSAAMTIRATASAWGPGGPERSHRSFGGASQWARLRRGIADDVRRQLSEVREPQHQLVDELVDSVVRRAVVRCAVYVHLLDRRHPSVTEPPNAPTLNVGHVGSPSRLGMPAGRAGRAMTSDETPRTPSPGTDSKVDDWFGQSVAKDAELADESSDELRPTRPNAPSRSRPPDAEQQARRGEQIDPEQGESAYRDG